MVIMMMVVVMVAIMEYMMENKMVIMMMVMKMVMGLLPQHLDGVALHLPQLPLLFKSCPRVPQLLAQLLCVRLQPDDDIYIMMQCLFVCHEK